MNMNDSHRVQEVTGNNSAQRFMARLDADCEKEKQRAELADFRKRMNTTWEDEERLIKRRMVSLRVILREKRDAIEILKLPQCGSVLSDIIRLLATLKHEVNAADQLNDQVLENSASILEELKLRLPCQEIDGWIGRADYIWIQAINNLMQNELELANITLWQKRDWRRAKTLIIREINGVIRKLKR